MEFEKIRLKRRGNCTACGDTFVPRPVDEVCETRRMEDEQRA